MSKENDAVEQALLVFCRAMAGRLRARSRAQLTQVIDELLCNQPSRTSRNIRDLTGASYALIRQRRAALGAPAKAPSIRLIA